VTWAKLNALHGTMSKLLPPIRSWAAHRGNGWLPSNPWCSPPAYSSPPLRHVLLDPPHAVLAYPVVPSWMELTSALHSSSPILHRYRAGASFVDRSRLVTSVQTK
jgi:hypothetical protein